MWKHPLMIQHIAKTSHGAPICATAINWITILVVSSNVRKFLRILVFAFAILHTAIGRIELSAWTMHMALGNDVVQFGVAFFIRQLSTYYAVIIHRGNQPVSLRKNYQNMRMRQASFLKFYNVHMSNRAT